MVLTDDVITWDESRQLTAKLDQGLIELNVENLAKIVQQVGVMAVYAHKNDLGFGLRNSDEIQMVFVDESGAAAERHFVNGKTGYSSLRRSLAALLRNKYDLEAIPRSDNKIDADRYDNFTLNDAGEKILTDWMREHLQIAVITVEKDKLRKTVQGLIDYNVPIFNLQNNKENKYGPEIKRLRKKCAQMAREWDANN